MIMSKAQKLFVHVGPAKTGTTALQKYLTSNAPEGLLYPQAGKWASRSHHSLALAVTGAEEIIGQDLRPAQTIEEFKAELWDAGRPALVSSEAIVELTYEIDGYLASLVAFLQRCSDDVEFIYTLRHPVARAASLYKFLVANFNYDMVLSPRAFLEDKLDALLIGPFLEQLDGLGLRCRTIQYEPLGTFVPRFLEMVGHPLGDYDYVGENVSLADDLFPVMLCVKRMFKDQAVRHQISRELRLAVSDSQATSAWPFDEETVAWLLKKVEEDRAALARRGIEYPGLTMKPRYRMTDETRARNVAFLKEQIEKFRHALRGDIEPDYVIRDVFDLFR